MRPLRIRAHIIGRRSERDRTTTMAALSPHYHYAMATADREARVVRELLNGAYLSALTHTFNC